MTEADDRYETDTEVCVVLTTCPDEAVAARLARTFVEQGLAACVTQFPGARSVYRWQGKIEEQTEVQLVIKTRRSRVVPLSVALAELHPYDEPEFLVLEAGGGRPAYLDWIKEETMGAAR